MRRIILLATMLVAFSANAQISKLRAKKSAFIEYAKKEKIEWNESDFLVVLNGTEKKITIYADVSGDDKREFNYYAVVALPKDKSRTSDTYGSARVQYKCIDVEGKECKITLAALDKKQSQYTTRLCVIYSSYTLMIDANPE